MSIQTEIKEALSELVPEISGDEPAPETESDGEDKKPVQAEKRSHGIIEHDYQEKGFHVDAFIEPGQVVRSAEIMFQRGFFLESVTGVDWIKEDELEVVYDYSRYDFDLCRVAIRTRIPRKTPVIHSITSVYTGANWHERETHDFFGIKFEGHPHLVPLLLPEDADFHPLLKDFK